MTNSKNYYEATANDRPGYLSLTGSMTADVCVVGAGFTGLGVALELVLKGFSVVVLEAKTVGFGASGRNGGQIASGYAAGMMDAKQVVGESDVAKLWEFSETAKKILYTRINRFNIKCDLGQGELYAAPKKSHLKWLREEQNFCEETFSYSGYQWIDRDEFRSLVAGERYVGALLDVEGGHLHPLNYTLGLADAAANAGALIFENTAALEIERGAKIGIRTASGHVAVNSLVLAGNAYLQEFKIEPTKHIIPVESSILATEPLGEERAAQIMATKACVADTYFDLDYFKMTPDTRLVYGGQDLSWKKQSLQNNSIRSNMLKTFPMLEDVKIDYMWSGRFAVTSSRLPDVGRIDSNIYYAHGYSGQGVLLSAVVSDILADAIEGEMGRLDVFSRIRNKNLPQSKLVQVPLLRLALLWNKIKDAL
ncbi:MAG: FAD-binding oxidoreductase [Sneathiella sp.]|nr:FAD-binding oxidoreductase [Sneathiella sp.]